ncbi:MAG: outer membrane protein assembly factor BamE [Alphaproteobacteria bacterium]|nr:MAG: outer membrane protein assembly factor BamE [Alphaproteobacteria bacterium]
MGTFGHGRGRKAVIGRRAALAGLGALALAGCAATYSFHGWVPSEEELAAIRVGKDTRESVAEKIGRPGAEGMIRDREWYYVAYTVRHYGAREPQVIDRQIVGISFDAAGRVANIERFTLADGRVIRLARRTTGTSVGGSVFLRQLVRNLGRVTLPGQ